MLTKLTDAILSAVPERHQRTAKQFIKFGITGAIGAVVDFGTFAILTRLVGWTATYTLFGTKIIAANNVSVFLAICSNFLINRAWTFQGAEGNVAKQGAGYFALNTFTWALNQIIVSLFVQWSLFVSLFGEERDFAAKAAAIVFILFINFFGSKLFIFQNNSKQEQTA